MGTRGKRRRRKFVSEKMGSSTCGGFPFCSGSGFVSSSSFGSSPSSSSSSLPVRFALTFFFTHWHDNCFFA